MTVAGGDDSNGHETAASDGARFRPPPRFDGAAAFREWVEPMLRSDMRVLDLDSHGPAVPSLKGKVREFVGGVASRAQRADPRFDHAVLIENDWLPLSEGSFDLVLCDGGLEHRQHPAALFVEAHRLLKPGGSFVFRTGNLRHPAVLRGHLAAGGLRRRLSRTTPRNAAFHRANTPSRLDRLARQAGFATLELRMVEDRPAEAETDATWASRLASHYSAAVRHFERLAGFRATIVGRLQR